MIAKSALMRPLARPDVLTLLGTLFSRQLGNPQTNNRVLLGRQRA
jgi:hypothetical protein